MTIETGTGAAFRTLVAVLLIVPLTAMMSTAWAGLPASYVFAGADVKGLGGFINHESPIVTSNFVTETNSLTQVSANGSPVSAAATASADGFGNLKVFAESTAFTQPNDNRVTADGSAFAAMADTIHILPPPGQTWQFLVTVEWAGNATAQCPTLGGCIVDINNVLRDVDSGLPFIRNDFQYQSGFPGLNTLPSAQKVQQIWTVTGGASYHFEDRLGLEVQTLGVPNSKFTGDLSHTGHFYFDPITPGATYTTASGRLFLTPTAVPEPNVTCLLAVGLAGLGATTWRRRARSA